MRTQSMDTSPEAERMLINLIRKAPITKRFDLLCSLTSFAIKLNRQNIREQYPNASEQKIVELFIADHYNHTLASGLQSVLKNKTIQLSETSNLRSAIVPMTEVFEQMRIPYYIKGTVANSIYGMQRATFDVDFAADIQQDTVAALLSHFKPMYYIDSKSVEAAVQYRTSFESLHLDSVVRINVHLSKDRAFDQEIYRRVQQYTFVENEQAFCIASPEEVVLTQLEEYRANGEVADDQWNEILGVLKVQGEKLNFIHLQHWAVILKVDDLLKKAYIDSGLSEAQAQ